MDKMLSATEVASQLQVSEQYVRRLLKAGKISGQQVGKTWVINPESLRTLMAYEDAKSVADRVCTVKRDIRYLSFFTGAMGLDLGLEKAGISPLLASEIDTSCRKTISANMPDVGLIGDIRNYSCQQIYKFSGLQEGDEIDLIAGGPPCQAFSTAGKRKGFEDERGNVFLHFIDLILRLRPKFVVIENVRGLLSAPLQHRPHDERGEAYSPLSGREIKGGALQHILTLLRAGGYGVSFNLYNAANFGSPQTRERVVLLCSRDGNKLPYLTPTHEQDGAHGLQHWKTLRDALKGLPKESHTYVKFPEKRLVYYRLLHAGQNWRQLPKDLQKEALGNAYYSGGGKTGFLRRLAWDKPSPTLVTHPAMPATDLAHPDEDRPLSVQEYKRIQEFPDDWVVGGSLIEQYKQLGNAVPVSLGAAIGNALMRHIRGENVGASKKFQYSRYLNTDDLSWEEQMRHQKPVPVKARQLSLLVGSAG